MNDEFVRLLITAVLSSGLVAGIFQYINKRSKSPESQNDLARIGNEFAAQLLEDAREERKELRLSITELEKLNDVKQGTIDRLKALEAQKDARIQELEQRRIEMGLKLRRGEPITLWDIFGHELPKFELSFLGETP